MKSIEYANQHVMITGGSSGIGKALAKLLVQQGASLSLIARDRHKLESACQEITALAPDPRQQVCWFSADVAVQADLESAIAQGISLLGTPQVLITSAGMVHPGYFAEIPVTIFEQTMAINYLGSLYAVKAIVPKMVEQGSGQVVLISSGAALVGIYGYSSYCPSKFALRGLAESLRGELAPQGIQVSIAYPPDTNTPQLAAENKIKPPETKKITASAKTWSAEAVAQEILRGLRTKQLAITPGLELTMLHRLHSLIAPLLNRYFDWLARQA